MSSVGERLLRKIRGATNVGIGISRAEIRFVGVNQVGLVVWQRTLTRGRGESPLAESIGKGLTDLPALLRGRARVACVVGPAEAQLRPLHGLPHLRSASEQLAVVTGSLDRFFVSEGTRMRVSSPVRGPDGEVWAAALDRDIVSQLADACRAHGARLIGVAPVAAALGHVTREASSPDATAAQLQWADDSTRLHVAYDATGRPTRIRRERAAIGQPELTGDLCLPDRVAPQYADAFAATRLRRHDAFVIGEHSDDARRTRLARQRTWIWAGLAVAGLVAAAWLPGALAAKRADRARARLTSLASRQHELRQVQSSLAGATTMLNGIAAFDASRRSATLLLAELALALPDSTAVTTLHADSLGGSLTILAPRVGGALQSVSGLPLMARVQMTGAVTREIAGGVELERASLRFVFQRRRPIRETIVRDSVSRLAVVAPRSVLSGPAPAEPRTEHESTPARPAARGGTQ